MDMVVQRNAHMLLLGRDRIALATGWHITHGLSNTCGGDECNANAVLDNTGICAGTCQGQL